MEYLRIMPKNWWRRPIKRSAPYIYVPSTASILHPDASNRISSRKDYIEKHGEFYYRWPERWKDLFAEMIWKDRKWDELEFPPRLQSLTVEEVKEFMLSDDISKAPAEGGKKWLHGVVSNIHPAGDYDRCYPNAAVIRVEVVPEDVRHINKLFTKSPAMLFTPDDQLRDGWVTFGYTIPGYKSKTNELHIAMINRGWCSEWEQCSDVCDQTLEVVLFTGQVKRSGEKLKKSGRLLRPDWLERVFTERPKPNGYE